MFSHQKALFSAIFCMATLLQPVVAQSGLVLDATEASILTGPFPSNDTSVEVLDAQAPLSYDVENATDNNGNVLTAKADLGVASQPDELAATIDSLYFSATGANADRTTTNLPESLGIWLSLFWHPDAATPEGTEYVYGGAITLNGYVAPGDELDIQFGTSIGGFQKDITQPGDFSISYVMLSAPTSDYIDPVKGELNLAIWKGNQGGTTWVDPVADFGLTSSSVPEPTSFVLFGIPVLGLAFRGAVGRVRRVHRSNGRARSKTLIPLIGSLTGRPRPSQRSP
jgi:hypothetical protein